MPFIWDLCTFTFLLKPSEHLWSDMLELSENTSSMGRPSSLRPMVLVAGGSGGHIFPAIALAEYAQRQKYPLILITDVRGARFIEGDRHFFSHVEIIEDFQVSRIFSLGSHLRTRYKQWNPRTILGFGGKMTILPLLVGKMMGKRCGIHQSDAIMGKANKRLSPLMDGIFVGHPLQTYGKNCGKKKKWHSIGTPVRRSFYGIPSPLEIAKPLNILILGGSQGAKIWSHLLPTALSQLSPEEQRAINIRHQCPLQDVAELTAAYKKLSLFSFQVSPFFYDMPAVLTWCHVVFSRGGASTLAELGAARRKAFLVPYPHAAQNHQQANAKAHIQEQGGWMADESNLTPKELTSVIQGWLDKPDQLLYGEKKSLATLDACAQLYEFCTKP